jgi:hypothetical protein
MNRETQTHTHKERERSNRVIKKKKAQKNKYYFLRSKFFGFSPLLFYTQSESGAVAVSCA